MTRYFVGVGGNNGNNGTTYALRRLTLTSAESLLAAGDELRIAPGSYRETLTTTVAGGSAYSTGTVSVTNGSAVVTGSGSAWLANAFANGMFMASQLAHGTDGVANGTTTFTSAVGNFQAGHVGMTIRVNTKAAYTITAVGSATSITLSGSPVAGSGLTYDVGPEPALEILSVDSNTQITLKEAWAAPSFTGLAYATWKDVKYIGDEDGQLTDGVGGEIRVTGSDNDQTSARGTGISCGSQYRTFRGIHFDGCSTVALTITAGNGVVENCTAQNSAIGFQFSGASALNGTLRKCYCYPTTGQGAVSVTHSSTVDNAAIVIENCVLIGGNGSGVAIVRFGGVLVRNLTIIGYVTAGIRVVTAPATGQATTTLNCVIQACASGIQATATSDMLEDYNDLVTNGAARTNVSVGSHSQAYLALMAMPLLTLGIHVPYPGALSPNSQVGAIAGFDPPGADMYNTARVATSSWGGVQYEATRRPNDAGFSAARRMGAK